MVRFLLVGARVGAQFSAEVAFLRTARLATHTESDGGQMLKAEIEIVDPTCSGLRLGERRVCKQLFGRRLGSSKWITRNTGKHIRYSFGLSLSLSGSDEILTGWAGDLSTFLTGF